MQVVRWWHYWRVSGPRVACSWGTWHPSSTLGDMHLPTVQVLWFVCVCVKCDLLILSASYQWSCIQTLTYASPKGLATIERFLGSRNTCNIPSLSYELCTGVPFQDSTSNYGSCLEVTWQISNWRSDWAYHFSKHADSAKPRIHYQTPFRAGAREGQVTLPVHTVALTLLSLHGIVLLAFYKHARLIWKVLGCRASVEISSSLSG